jgi:hypothetical protein
VPFVVLLKTQCNYQLIHAKRKQGKEGKSMASKLSNGRRWKKTELKGDSVGKFKEYCRDMHLNFVTSECKHGYTHFEVLVDKEEEYFANKYLETI